MKKLSLKTQNDTLYSGFLDKFLDKCKSKEDFVNHAKGYLSDMTVEFYDYIGEILNRLGFNTLVTREGDVNCRFDATIKDSTDSIPIEIKSPLEVMEINIKAITQACENKIVLMSRNFFPTRPQTTSLAIGFEYPPSRSDVYELVDDIHAAYQINIGLIDVSTLLRLVYAVEKEGATINKEYFNNFKGILEYEKTINKRG